MNKIYFSVGPTEVFPEVKNFLNEAIKEKYFSISHRSEKFSEIYKLTCDELKKLLNIPDDYYIFFLGSATECMERIIQNLVEKKSYHFINGYFAGRFYNISKSLKKKQGQVKASYDDGFRFDKIKIPQDTELICFTQNETSTGMAIDMQDIYKIKEKNPDKIVAVDIVSSVPYVEIDYRKIDCAFFSVQKGFGLPPGLGVVVIKKNCIEKTKILKEKKINIGGYYDFIMLAENAEKFQTAVTPNIPGIYLLGKVCKMLNNKGIDKIWKETEEKAELLYNILSKHKYINPFIKNEKDRSYTTLVFDVAINSGIIADKMSKKGFEISRGYRDLKDTQIRIANFPVHKLEEVKKLIKALYRL